MTREAPSLPSAHILVVDDEPDLRTLYELTLLREGHRVEAAGTLAQARESLAKQHFDVLITDMRLPDGLGLELLQALKHAGRPERTIVITAYGSAESAVEALKQGAFDYLTKPVDLKQFRTVVAAAIQQPLTMRGASLVPPGQPTKAAGNVQTAQPTPAQPEGGRMTEPAPGDAAQPLGAQSALRRLVGQSRPMQLVKERIQRVAGSMAPVMILGESGTGKELVARALHNCSHRAHGPFVAVNCGAIPENLIEAEFFGARKGAYTGATTDREGYFTAARGGTLFLDEIGDLPLAMQAKLLRVVQERRVRPLGGVGEEQVDVRVLCATHHDLPAAVEHGRFRQDLFFRLNVIEIHLPPLRERRDDLETLADTLMRRICRDSGQHPVPLSDAAKAWLQQHPFLGNVRELENLLHRALALCDGQQVAVADLLDQPVRAQVGTPVITTTDTTHASSSAPVPAGPAAIALPCDLPQQLDALEKTLLLQALHETKGNRTAAAARLGLNLRQIRYRIARLNIDVPGPDDAPPGDDDADAGAPPP